MQDTKHLPVKASPGGTYRHRETISVLLAYSLLTVIMTWPLTVRLGTHLAGDGDMWEHQWTFWWVKHSIMGKCSPFYTNLLFYPQGVSLAFHNFAWLQIAAWLPLQAVFGRVVAYNLIFITVFPLNGFAVYLLAREVTGSKPAAFVGGLIYGFWPYTLSHYEHPNLVLTCWIPLTLLYLRRTLEQGNRRDALLVALFLFLTGVTRWHLLIMGGAIIGLYLTYKCLREKACRTRHTLELLVLIGFVAGILMAPLAAPIAVAQLVSTQPEEIFVDEQTTGQTDLLAYVLPSRYQPLWGDAVSHLYDSFNVNKTYIAFLGYTTIALALYGAAKNWQQSCFWMLAAVTYIALALGPQLRINGQLHPNIPMPYRMVGDLFLIRVLRKPDRFNIFLGLPIGMLSSLGVATLLRRRRFSRNSILLVGIVGTLILSEYCPAPYPTQIPSTPAWYKQLAQEPNDFAVLDLPTHGHTFDKRYMFYQTTHGKPLVEGHVSRPPTEALTFINSVPFLKYVRQHNVMDPALVDISHQLRLLADAGIRYVVLHKKFASQTQLAAWQDWLTFEPYHEDTDVVVYRTEPRLGRDFSLVHSMTDEIGLIRAAFTPTTTIQAGLIEADARWGSSGTPRQDYKACLNLINTADEVAQSDCELLSPTWPTSRWKASEVTRGVYALQVDPFLEAGTYSATLALTDGAVGATTGHPFVLGSLQIEAQPRVFSEPSPTHPLHVLWGDVILLRGYDLQLSAEVLDLTLYWQAQRRMDTSYKIFVHLIDSTTGGIVVQDDAVPRQWTYPTTWWEHGEVIEDTISLAISDVSPGQYRLTIGLYDPGTGERLPAYSTEGNQYPDGALTLTVMLR